ncbi:WSC-domain-containing protein, partial [Saccharata proteae CBS 121410]
PIAVARIDPILSPGQVGSHLHSFIGSDALAPTMDFAQTQTASCSQVYVKPDKSSYWQPKLFFQDPNNKTFTIVPESHRVLYYQNRASDPETGESDPSIIQEFPEDFRMIAGDAMQRAPAETEQLQNVIQWFCHGPDVQSSGFPNFTSCPDGLAASVQFPYCWNGDDIDINNPSAHVSYPNNSAGNAAVDSGACPSTHPKILPHIFIEFWFDTTSFDGLYTESDSPWVLAQGDPTGYGMHADFLNGWETGVLENAMKNCDIGESGRPLSECFDVYTDDERNACSVGQLVNEDVSGWLDALPGCNPLQDGPSMAVMKTGCGDDATLAVGGLPSGWTSSGCYTDALTPRSLSGITFAWWGEAMTSTGCANYCANQGFSIAGTENSSQCFCGNELSGSQAVDSGKCDMTCDGEDSQTCGGAAVLSVYSK